MRGGLRSVAQPGHAGQRTGLPVTVQAHPLGAVAEHPDDAGAAVVPRVGKLETVVAPELQLPVAVARQADAAERHAVVEELHAGVTAGAATDGHRLLPHLQPRIPVPAKRAEGGEQQDLAAHWPAESGLTGLRNSAATCFFGAGRVSAGALSLRGASLGT